MHTPADAAAGGRAFESALTHGAPVRVSAGDWGKGVHVERDTPKGSLLWAERPMFIGQCLSHKGEVCAECLRPTARYTGADPLPAIPKGCERDAGLFDASDDLSSRPEPVSCKHGCEWYCSAVCKAEAHYRHHSVVCSDAYCGLLKKWTEDEPGRKMYNQRLLAFKLLCGSTVELGDGDAELAARQQKALDHIAALVELPYAVCAEETERSREEAFFGELRVIIDGVAPEAAMAFTFEKYLTMLSKLKANAVELDLGLKLAGEDPARMSAQKASALFALQAFVNHSCNPNGHRVFYNGRLHFLAVQDVKADDQLLMAYVNPTNTLKDRQAKLTSHWKILCTCERCTQDTMKLVMLKQLLAGLKQKKEERAA